MKINVPLRNWQKEAQSVWLKEHRGVAAVVTGGGKTVFALSCASECFQQGDIERVIVTVPTIPLQHQWAIAVTTLSDVPKTKIGLLGGGHRLKDSSSFCVAVMGSAASFDWSSVDPRRTMLIVDECHHIGTVRNRKILDHGFKVTLGLSATPERQYDNFFETFVEPFLGPIIYRYGYERALEDKVIVPFSCVNIKIPASEPEKEELDVLSSRIKKLASISSPSSNQRDMLKSLLLRRMQRSNAILARRASVWPSVATLGLRRGIIFTDTIESCEEIVALSSRTKLACRAYHSGQSPVRRQLNLELYALGQIDVLVTCAALDEGFDVPGTEFAFLCASTSSTRRRIQRMGRALRPTVVKSEATIVSFYALENERRVLEAAAAESWNISETRWMEVKRA